MMNESAAFSESDELVLKTGNETGRPVPETHPFIYNAEEDATGETGKTEELPPLIIPGPKGIISGLNASSGKSEAVIHYAKRCAIGARERNEDSCIAFASETGGHFTMMPFGLYIVADGMGGTPMGMSPAKLLRGKRPTTFCAKSTYPCCTDTPPQIGIRDTLVDAVQIANTAVYQDEPEVDSGTTLTAALLLGSRLHVAHVGDSRLYLHTDEKLEAVTNDHSLVQRLQDVGQLTAEEATVYRYRNVLLRAVGQGEEVEIDTYMRLLPKKGKLFAVQ
ncbi:MAG: serine/threonine-protein phosphatase [Anaerolineae bacterium]|nr:serine/threonine-protein phosphatase [Anaerolineae bacterium]